MQPSRQSTLYLLGKKHPNHVEVWIDKSHVAGFCQLMRHYDPFKEVQWQINSEQIMSQFINIPTQSIPWELYLIQQHIPTLAAKIKKIGSPPNAKTRSTPRHIF